MIILLMCSGSANADDELTQRIVQKALHEYQERDDWKEAYDEAGLLNWHNEYQKAKDAIDRALVLAPSAMLPSALLDTEILAGRIYMGSGDYQRAEEIMLSSLDRIQHDPVKDQQSFFALLNTLARLHVNQKEYDKAEEILLDIDYQYKQMYLPQENGEFVRFYRSEPEAFDRALQAAPRSSDISTGFITSLHEYGRSMNRLQKLYREIKKFSPAAEACEETVYVFGRTMGTNHSFVETITKECAEIYRLDGKLDLAAEAYERTLKVSAANHGVGSIKNVSILEGLIAVHKQLDHQSEADKYQKQKDLIRNN